MGEAKRTGPHGGIHGALAPRAFVQAWFVAMQGEPVPVEFTDRQMGDGMWIVLARIGRFSALLTPEQCRGIAAEFEARLDNPDVAPIVQPMSDLIVALRAAADEFERLHPVETTDVPA